MYIITKDDAKSINNKVGHATLNILIHVSGYLVSLLFKCTTSNAVLQQKLQLTSHVDNGSKVAVAAGTARPSTNSPRGLELFYSEGRVI